MYRHSYRLRTNVWIDLDTVLSPNVFDSLMDSRLRYLGVVSGISGWIVILFSVSLNPWFVFTEHAFSDLGGRLSDVPWVFNYGMMFTGLLIIGYGFYLVNASKNKIQTVGSAFTISSGVFLVLIGVFPSGIKHHFFVSVWFFTQTDIAIGTWGLGLLKGDYDSTGKLLLGMSIVGPLIAAIIDWPSTAVVEAYGILIMNIWVILMAKIR